MRSSQSGSISRRGALLRESCCTVSTVFFGCTLLCVKRGNLSSLSHGNKSEFAFKMTAKKGNFRFQNTQKKVVYICAKKRTELLNLLVCFTHSSGTHSNFAPKRVQVAPPQQGSFMTAPTNPERKRQASPGDTQPADLL